MNENILIEGLPKQDPRNARINHANDIDEAMPAKYKVFIQLPYPPYTWNDKAMVAFVTMQ